MILSHTIRRLPQAGFLVRCAPVYALCVMLASPALGQNAAGQDRVQATDYDTVTMAVQDTELATVLQMLALETKKNIIVGKSVSGTVSVNLFDATFDQALRAILEPNGYTYYAEGNFIYVITREEAKAIEDARRKTESRIFELDNLAAADALEFVLPLLSPVGKASARGDVLPGIKPDVSDGGADTYAFNPRLVVNDYTENLADIATLLGELDTKPMQVLVEATILQTSLDEANAFGVDFSAIGSMNFTDLTSPLGAVNNLLAGSDAATGFQPADNTAGAAATNVGNTTGPGGLKVGIITDDISVFLRLLDEVTDSTVLARPKVMALNRQRAQVLVGARVGYLSTTATETTTTQSVEFLDTGIELVFRPFISRDGSIRMELSPSVSEASLRSVTDANGLIVTIPDELTNELTSNVRIQDGETLVLGGLFKDSTRITRRQVPLLGDIPVLGAAFRGQDDSVERTEIIFLITPSIVHDDVLWQKGQESMAAVDSMRVGAREGLLPFSNEKITANYNQRANKAWQQGDNDKALYYIHNSLRVSPNQPEMIRLREKITGERATAHERSQMERVFRKEMSDGGQARNMQRPAPEQPLAAPGANITAEWKSSPTSGDNVASVWEMPSEHTGEGEQPESITSGASGDDEAFPMLSEPQSNAQDWDVDGEVSATTPWSSDGSMPDSIQKFNVVVDTDFVDEPVAGWRNAAPGTGGDVGQAWAELAVPMVKPDTSTSPAITSTTSTSSLKGEQKRLYHNYMHTFFTALGLPHIASDFNAAAESEGDAFPFVTFDEVVGVTETDPQH